ncbi:hypothetical protein ACEQPO_10905 [Bacillus sp. SL00103]
MQEQDKLISFAYVGTTDGKMLGFPEFDLGKGYDPSKQGWFKQAVEKPDQVVLDRSIY